MKKLVQVLFYFFGILVLICVPVSASYELWKVNPDGQGLKQLTNVSSKKAIPWSLSPDGKEFAVGRMGGLDIYNFDGKILRSYPGGARNDYKPLIWTKNGILVEVKVDDSKNSKWILVNSSTLKKIDEWQFENCDILYPPSPTGKYIMYTSGLDESKNELELFLYIFNLETREEKLIGTCPIGFHKAVWSPDEKMVAFDSNHELNFVDLDGKLIKKLTGYGPEAWSPNGKYFAAFGLFKFEILDTNTWEKITSVPAMTASEVIWSPDSLKFCFSEMNDRLEYPLWTGDLKGNLKRITKYYEECSSDYKWSLDSKFIIFSSSLKPVVPFTSSYDFRKINWGMSRQAVKKTEQAKPEEEESNYLLYKVNVSDMDSTVVYYFQNDKLVQSGYIYQEKRSKDNDYIDDYEKVKDTLALRYGYPMTDTKTWRNRLYQDDYDKYGLAVKMGHLKYSATWETDKTSIELKLDSEDQVIYLVVIYTSKQYFKDGDDIAEDVANY